MANFFRCVMLQTSATIPAGSDTTQPLPFQVQAMNQDGSPDATYSGQVHIVKQADASDDSYTVLSATGEWGQPAVTLQNGAGNGLVVFKVFKTYAPGPWIDLAIKAVSMDGTLAGGSANWCHTSLPPNLGPVTSHVVRLSQKGVTLAQGTVPTLDGLLLEIDGKGVWAPPVSPFGGFTGSFG